MKRTIFLIGLFCLVWTGCGESSEPLASEDRAFFDLGLEKMGKLLPTYPLERQIGLLILGRTRPHPPISFYGLVCRIGEPIVPLLIKRVGEYTEMERIRPVVVCLSAINKWHFKWVDEKEYAEMWESALARQSDLLIRKEVQAIMATGKSHPFFKGINYEEKRAGGIY